MAICPGRTNWVNRSPQSACKGPFRDAPVRGPEKHGPKRWRGKRREKHPLTNFDLEPFHDPEVRFTLGHRHFTLTRCSEHVHRQFINDGSFKKVIDSWFVCVLPSEKRSHSCEMLG